MIRKTTTLLVLLTASTLAEESLDDSIDATKTAIRRSNNGKKISTIEGKVEELPWNYKDALADTNVSTWIGAGACLGFVTWLWMMFFYASSGAADTTMRGTLPIAWMWGNLNNTSVGFTAAAYFCFFWGYMIVFVPEVFMWLKAESGGDPLPLAWWAYYFGTWINLVLGAFPWIFAMI